MFWLIRILFFGIVITLVWWGMDGNDYCGSQMFPCEATPIEGPPEGCTIDPLTGLMQGDCR